MECANPLPHKGGGRLWGLEMQLTKEQFEQGRKNYRAALGLSRRDFLKASAAVPAAGALYFGYSKLHGPPVRAGIVGVGNEGCLAMIDQSPPDYLEYVAYHDIRPSQIARGRKFFQKVYGTKHGAAVKFYERWEDMLADPAIEAIVIATPLWTHARFAIDAMKAGKHVFCEKLMARTVTDAKAMVRTADQYRRLLAIGHQRHYSVLYDDAVQVIKSGALGEIKHIRALWHRNNTQVDPKTGRILDAWNPPIPKEDQGIDFTPHGYKSVEELVRWRLYDKTGGGLMAELGSHQLDAASIFLGKEYPLAVSGVGGKYYFTDDRDCEDHVYCTFEFPNGRVVTYSSINTNALEGYGEIVMGTRGTMMVMHERETLLFNEKDPLGAKRQTKKTEVTVESAKPGEATMYSAASIGLRAEAAKTGGADVSRGYREELEHFAWCIRNPEAENALRCDGRVGLADALMALVAIKAIRSGKRIVFQKSWFDPMTDDVPDREPAALAAGS